MCLGARIMQKSVIAFIYTWTLWHFYLCKQIFLAQLKHSALRQILLSWGGDATWVLLLLKENGSNLIRNIIIKFMYIFTFCSNICADNIISHENKYYIKKECKIHAFSLLVSECVLNRCYCFACLLVYSNDCSRSPFLRHIVCVHLSVCMFKCNKHVLVE